MGTWCSGEGGHLCPLGPHATHVSPCSAPCPHSYQLGSGEATIVSEDPVNDGEWHHVMAARWGRDTVVWGLGLGHGC